MGLSKWLTSLRSSRMSISSAKSRRRVATSRIPFKTLSSCLRRLVRSIRMRESVA